MTWLRMRGRGEAPSTPTIVTQPSIQSSTPGTYRVGVPLVATPPTYTPAVSTLSGAWVYSDGSPVPGANDALDTYTPVSADEALSIKRRYTVTYNSSDVVADTAAVGPIEAEAPSAAPVVANQTLNFGRNAITGQYSEVVANTGGAITSASITSGNGSGHWQISATGVLSPASTRTLDASYTLGCSFTNASGTDTATITIPTEADAWDAATTTQMTAAMSALGSGVSTPKKVYLLSDSLYSLTPGSGGTVKAWFDSKVHTAEVTIQSRTDIDNTPAIFDLNSIGGTAWRNFRFKNIKWNCRFLRETYRDATYALVINGGAWGTVIFDACDLAGDCVNLGPGIHFKGFVGFNNVSGLNISELDLRFINGTRLHGMWRMLNLSPGQYNVGNPLALVIDGLDVYDMGLDGLVMSGGWQSISVQDLYVHSPFINDQRVGFADNQDDVMVRNTAWTGAADGKKVFMAWSGTFRSLAGSADTLYQQGSVGAEKFKLWRDNSGYIRCTLADTGGTTVVDMTSGQAYTTGSMKLVVLISVDTDTGAKMQIWREQNGGGGTWYDSATDTTAGETLDLASAAISVGGTPTKTEKLHGWMTRMHLWLGQAPDITTTPVRELFLPDNDYILDGPISAIVAEYGTPIMYLEGDSEYWNGAYTGNNAANTNASGTGGPFDDAPLVEIDHGDLVQTLFGRTMTGNLYSNWVLFSGFDTSPVYARIPAYDLQAFKNYYGMQGLFAEDQNSNNYQEDYTVEDLTVMCGSPHGISLYNLRDSTVSRCVAVVPSSWNPHSSSFYPRIRAMEHGSAPLGGNNAFTDCFAYEIAAYGTGNTETNCTEGVAPANYASYMTDGTAPTTKAEVLAYVAGAI